MGPVRGFKKRRKAKKVGDDGVSALFEQNPVDWWVTFSKRITGPPLRRGLNQFESIFKISMKTFNYICSLVKEDFVAKPTSFSWSNGKLVSVNDLVAIALRRLSSGDSLSAIGDLFGMNQSMVSQVTWRFVEAMEERGLCHLQWPNTEDEMQIIKTKFENIRGFPNCCGAIDITHITMCLPLVDSNDVWVDGQKNHSMILQAIVDPDMRFRDVVTGWPGCMSDSLVMKSSAFSNLCDEGRRLNGKMIELSDGSQVREYIVGDVGFPLLPWLITPYQVNDPTSSEADFNRRHLATRLVARRALARLKNMWKIVQGQMWMPDKRKLPRIILACCLLHNIVIDLEDDVQDELPLSYQHDADYKQQFCDAADADALVIRDSLSRFLSGGSFA